MVFKMKPTRLYIKRHSITGMRYLGKTTSDDVVKYPGSGKYWTNHINRHGIDHVVTDWVSEFFVDKNLLVEFATFLSEELDIVNSNQWANLKEENGLDGGLITDEIALKISNTMKLLRANPEWKATTGVKIISTFNDPEWKRTVGEQKKAKLAAYFQSPEGQQVLHRPKTEQFASQVSATVTSQAWKDAHYKTCSHCSKTVHPSVYARLHENKCKYQRID